MASEVELLTILTKAGFDSVEKSDISALKKRGLKYLFSFRDNLEGKTTELLVGFDENFPLSLPSFFIKNYEGFQFIPHVETDGWICYTRDDNVFIDYDDPTGVVKEAYGLAKTTILSGIRQENKNDFTNEFEAYWVRLPGIETVLGNLKIAVEPTLIKVGIKEKTHFLISEENEFFEGIQRFIDLSKKGITYENGVYIPLKRDYYPQTLRSNEPVTFAYFCDMIQNGLEEKQFKALKKLCDWAAKTSEYVIISFRQPDGVYSLFGFRFSWCKKHPVTERQFEGKINPVAIQRVDKEYMVRRGGNGETFFDKKGLIVGAGSIGGFVVEELVRSGFLNLDVVDDDKLTIDNCYRHLLGFEYLDRPKVDGIKLRIEKIFPHAKIGAIKGKIERLVGGNKIDLKEYDFIVIATGNVTVNHFLNRTLAKLLPKPAFFLWNEPYGIGGHVLVSNLTPQGCYACLYDTPERNNRGSFASKIQPRPFLKAISGCATMYTPFSSLDSRNTACLAARKIIDVQSGRFGTNALFSWKGEADIFVNEGFNLSDRYKMSDVALFDSSTLFASATCPECSKGN